MAYTVAWNEASPLGSDPANTLHTIIQNKQIATRERLAGIFGLTALEWAADPIVPKTLSLSVDFRLAATGKLFLDGGGNTYIHEVAPDNLQVVTGGVAAGIFAGGALSANVIGNITGNLTGTILTAAQGNITSLGVLSGLTIGGSLSFSTSGSAILGFNDANGLVFGINTVNTYWRLQTTGHLVPLADNAYNIGAGGSRVKNIFSINFTGDLAGNVSGNVTGNLTGTVLTAAQANITSLGTLTGLTVAAAGIIDFTTASLRLNTANPVGLPSGAAGAAGLVFIDGVNHRILWWEGGTRYYTQGTVW